MSFIELAGIDDVTEKKTVAEGVYDLVVTANPQAKKNENSGKYNLLVVLAIEGHPEAANIMHNLALPGTDDEVETKNFKLLQIKRFCHHFGISLKGGMNTETFAGSMGKNIPVVKDEYQGTISNKLKLPPLPMEA